MEAFTALITTLGFPIACVVGLAYFVSVIWTKTQQLSESQAREARESSQKREDKFMEQINKFNSTLQDFNITLVRIDTRLESLERCVSIKDVMKTSSIHTKEDAE